MGKIESWRRSSCSCRTSFRGLPLKSKVAHQMGAVGKMMIGEFKHFYGVLKKHHFTIKSHYELGSAGHYLINTLALSRIC
jgi:hypothetical protein